MAVDNKIRMSFSIDRATKEKLDKFKAAGIDLNLSSIINDILQFNLKSVETYIDCMLRIHQPHEKEFTRIYAQNGILILGELEETKKLDYLRTENLSQPEILSLINKLKQERQKNENIKGTGSVEEELLETKKRIKELETLSLSHNSEIKNSTQRA